MEGRQGRASGKPALWADRLIWGVVVVGIPANAAFAVYAYFAGGFEEASAFLHLGAAGPCGALATVLVLQAFAVLVAIEAYRSRKWCDLAPFGAFYTMLGGGNVSHALTTRELTGLHAMNSQFTFWAMLVLGLLLVGCGTAFYFLLKRGPPGPACPAAGE